MTDKEIFIENLKNRTKEFAVNVIGFCETLNASRATNVITYQLIKSATSTGANYRAACNARSKKEFFSKICIVVEEIDESKYWLELIQSTNLSKEKESLNGLLIEGNEIAKIMGKAKTSMYEKN
ncbi:MAG: four helix bundle protein [Chitinophagales bacterium]